MPAASSSLVQVCERRLRPPGDRLTLGASTTHQVAFTRFDTRDPRGRENPRRCHCSRRRGPGKRSGAAARPSVCRIPARYEPVCCRRTANNALSSDAAPDALNACTGRHCISWTTRFRTHHPLASLRPWPRRRVSHSPRYPASASRRCEAAHFSLTALHLILDRSRSPGRGRRPTTWRVARPGGDDADMDRLDRWRATGTATTIYVAPAPAIAKRRV
jgi:hypothetical protein